MRLRSGLISSDSLGKNFEDWWTSSLEAIRANHFPAQESDSEEKTRDTSGRLSQAAFDFFNLESASLKTSRATLPKGSITSCLTWEDWVTEQRGEFSARVNAAHRINGNEFSSWPTTNAQDWKDSINGTHPPSRPNLSEQTLGQAVSVAHGKSWATPAARDTQGQRGVAANARKGNPLDTLPNQMAVYGLPAPANPSTHGSRRGWLEINPQIWGTPRASERGDCPSERDRHDPDLRAQVVLAQSWATPKASDPQHSGPNMRDSAGNYALPAQAVRANQTGGKLNPRWVETLMGLPVGWTMPSCVSPVTIAPTSYDSSATGSCQQLLNEHSAS